MIVQFSRAEIKLLLTSLEYSKRNIVAAENTPLEVRNNNLQELESLAAKLREMRKVTSD
jgi:hypothetical protein